MPQVKRPIWWQMNGIVLGAVVLLWWEGRAQLAAPLRQIVPLGIVVLVHSLIAWWVQANQEGLKREHLERQVRAHTRQIVAELKQEERARARARQAAARETQRQQAQAGCPKPGRDAAQGLALTPIQAHFHQVMLKGRHQKS